MPELPDVALYLEAIDARIVGHVLEQVRLRLVELGVGNRQRGEQPDRRRPRGVDQQPLLGQRPGHELRRPQRAVVLQLERLMDYPMVRRRVEDGSITLHGWHYVIEDGEVHVFDVHSGSFVAASKADHSGTGPYMLYEENDDSDDSDDSDGRDGR